MNDDKLATFLDDVVESVSERIYDVEVAQADKADVGKILEKMDCLLALAEATKKATDAQSARLDRQESWVNSVAGTQGLPTYDSEEAAS